MKVALVNGSPRGKKASSLSLLGGLKNYLKEADEALQIQEMMWNKPDSGTKDFDEIL